MTRPSTMSRLSVRIAILEARANYGVRYMISNRPPSDEEREANLTGTLDDGHEMSQLLTEEE
ncbi:hypothetical protein AB4Z40_34675 [Bosea sp. 2YAB26]|uniref:hypothetical protein n=1 Tax=Bosea sp. 2YAB26 TaxID=3237478 RepID=UPI003F90A111